MGKLNLLGGQNNLLGGQMSTQLTCYLPPCPLPLATHHELPTRFPVVNTSFKRLRVPINIFELLKLNSVEFEKIQFDQKQKQKQTTTTTTTQNKTSINRKIRRIALYANFGSINAT